MGQALVEAEVASLMQVSVRMLRTMMRQGKIPAPMNIDSHITKWVWSPGAVEAYLAGTYRGATVKVENMPATPKSTSQASAPAVKGKPKRAKASKATEEVVFAPGFRVETLADGSLKVVGARRD